MPAGFPYMPTPYKPQVVAARCAIPSSRWGNGSGTRTDTIIQARRKLFIGPQDVSQLQLAVPGYYLTNALSGEQATGNDITFNGALEIVSPANYFPLYSNSAPGINSKINIPNGMPYLLTQPLNDIDMAKGDFLYSRVGYSVASSSGDWFPSSSQPATTNETGWVAPTAVSQIYATGAMTTPGGGSAFGGPLPLMIIGVPKLPHCSVFILGDSIANGSNDTVDNTTGAIGFIARGLNSVYGYTIPYTYGTVGSDTFANNLLTNGWRKRALWPFHTHLICELGTNDIAAGTSLATLQGYATAVWTAAKRVIGPYGKPLTIMQTLIAPRTTSTDAWATAANQTPVAGFTVGGVRDQFNAWVLTQVGNGLLDMAVDPNSVFEDQLNHGKWVTTGAANYPTSDGIHPSPALHLLAAAVVNAWALQINP